MSQQTNQSFGTFQIRKTIVYLKKVRCVLRKFILNFFHEEKFMKVILNFFFFNLNVFRAKHVFVFKRSLTIINEGLLLKIGNEGLSLTIVKNKIKK